MDADIRDDGDDEETEAELVVAILGSDQGFGYYWASHPGQPGSGDRVRAGRR